MKFLIDTNVFIPLEPTEADDFEALTKASAEFSKIAAENGHQLYLHPHVLDDINRDRNSERLRLRIFQASKYPDLKNPPKVPSSIKGVLGIPEKGTNDWVDNQLLAALYSNAVDFLISEDRGIHRKAKRLGLAEQVATIEEATSIIRDFSETTPEPPPSVKNTKAYELDIEDPIFDSLRSDYKGFDKWFAKCCKEHRTCWVIRRRKDSNIGGICIINKEEEIPTGLDGKILKICTLKISETSNGFRYGELLLKAIFEYSLKNEYNYLYLTVFEKHRQLLLFLDHFGFSCSQFKNERGELVLYKKLYPDLNEATTLSPIEYNIRYGPFHIHPITPGWFVIPIRQDFSDILFPETQNQSRLFGENTPYGNAIRKAYLCHASTSKLQNGSLVFFYRTQGYRGIISIGVVEQCIRSKSYEEIARNVGKRTIYSLADIKEMCSHPRTVLAILFRQARVFKLPIKRKELQDGKVFQRPPQSIMEIGQEGKEWLRKTLGI